MIHHCTLLLFFSMFFSLGFAQTTIDSTRLLRNLEELSSDEYEGRNTGEKGNAMARAYIIEQLDSIGLQPMDSTFVAPFQFWSRFKKKKYAGKNIIGCIKGQIFPNQYIVLSAHYDHVGVKGEKVYNGADDNASGTCGLIELAAYFVQHPPQHSIIIAAFDAEELGLQGAKCFVDEPPMPRDSIILNINMDMISRSDSSTINICGTHHYPALRPPLDSLVKPATLNFTYGHDGARKNEQDWTYSSDHGSFHQEGIPFLYFGVEDHQDYHQPTDDFENIHPSFYTEVVRFILDAVVALDTKWNNLDKLRN